MRTFPSVDLPDPLGPINACVSPRSMVSDTPLRMSTPPAEAWRSSMTRSGVSGIRERRIRVWVRVPEGPSGAGRLQIAGAHALLSAVCCLLCASAPQHLECLREQIVLVRAEVLDVDPAHSEVGQRGDGAAGPVRGTDREPARPVPGRQVRG